jgi:hypothetical protein
LVNRPIYFEPMEGSSARGAARNRASLLLQRASKRSRTRARLRRRRASSEGTCYGGAVPAAQCRRRSSSGERDERPPMRGQRGNVSARMRSHRSVNANSLPLGSPASAQRCRAPSTSFLFCLTISVTRVSAEAQCGRRTLRVETQAQQGGVHRRPHPVRSISRAAASTFSCFCKQRNARDKTSHCDTLGARIKTKIRIN